MISYSACRCSFSDPVVSFRSFTFDCMAGFHPSAYSSRLLPLVKEIPFPFQPSSPSKIQDGGFTFRANLLMRLQGRLVMDTGLEIRK